MADEKDRFHALSRLFPDLANKALATLEADTANQSTMTVCGTRFLSAERALRIVERYGFPVGPQSFEALLDACDQAGSGFNLLAIERTIAGAAADDLPF